MSQSYEIDPSKIVHDTRSSTTKALALLFRASTFRFVLIVAIPLQIYSPALWPLWVCALTILTMSFEGQKFRMPLRMPKDVGGLDRTEYEEQLIERVMLWGIVRKSRILRKLLQAGGILYLGYLRSTDEYDQGRELWLTNSDARTHMFLAGTTGSGKTETLMGILYNAICWGSGACYGDGKADSNLAFCVWSLSRRHGREDDFLLLNYLTGGMDPFDRLVDQEGGRIGSRPKLAQSNSMNSFSEGSADFLLQLMASLLPRAGGDGAQWQQKALSMIDALLRTLCYKRAKGELDLSVGVIRHYLALQNLVQFYIEGRDGGIPELAWLPIKAYFETGLPGFNPASAHDPSQWGTEAWNQHGYLTGQFARMLSMMMDTYGFIFEDKYPEIDMLDVLLNNRILVVMIPSLEKSASEAASLGRLYISSIRLMMAQNLGYRLEGTRAEVLDTKATNAPNPCIIISDELGYYFAEGIAVMFAQARSLGFMMVAAVQDIQSLKRGEAKEESASMIANTKVKWTLALEDPEDTFELIRKSGGEAVQSVLAGYDAVSGMFATSMRAQQESTIERRDRITLDKVKSLNSGEGFVIFKDATIPSASFYLSDEDKKSAFLKARINRFVQVERPQFKRLPPTAEKVGRADSMASDYIVAQFRRNEKPYYPVLDDPILEAVSAAAQRMREFGRFAVTPVERGIVLFEAGRKAMKEAAASGAGGYFHRARLDEPAELELDGLETEIPATAFEDHL